jgi:hypothetical protein
VVISEVLGALPDDLVTSVRRDLEMVLSSTFHAHVLTNVLDASNPRMALGPEATSSGA